MGNFSITKKPTLGARFKQAGGRMWGGVNLLRQLASLGGFETLFLLLFFIYLALFIQNLAPLWFNPLITTDDGRQQLFPFYEALYPDRFQGDLVFEVMKGYLSPVHYWLGYGITKLTHDPVMTGHWMMLIQLMLAAVFLFLLVRHLTHWSIGFFVITWMLHSRNVVQRMTCGLPRGWALPLIAAGLYFIVTKRHSAVLIVLLIGCLTNQPATIVIAATYGLVLLLRVMNRTTRPATLRPLLVYLTLAPLYIVIVFSVVTPPEMIGPMVTTAQAYAMPEFGPGGRFAFLPLPSIWNEVTLYGMQPFLVRGYRGALWLKEYMPLLAFGFIVLGSGLVLARGRRPFPIELAVYFLTVAAVYLLSRQVVFQLYVPDRHLRAPLAVFFFVVIPVILWGLGQPEITGERRYSKSKRVGVLSGIAFLLLATFLMYSGGTGFTGPANFNVSIQPHGRVFLWMREHTEADALIAGQPTYIDPVQLFAVRRGYATTETFHPFYPKYNAEMERRLAITFRAYYAKDLQELLQLLKPEGIDYFVFRKDDFYPENLKKAAYYPPLDNLVRELAAREATDYAYRSLPRELNPLNAPYMVYRDHIATVIDLKRLDEFLAAGKPLPTLPPVVVKQ
jgi:hypothetical protein